MAGIATSKPRSDKRRSWDHPSEEGEHWKREAEETDDHYKLRPELVAFTLARRCVYIVFDADHLKNQHVRQAEIRLAFMLHAAGADVFQLSVWPLKEGKGIDDYLALKAGTDPAKQRKELASLLDGAVPFLDTLDEHDIPAVKKELHRIEMDPAQFAALAKVLAKRLGTTKRALGAYEYDEEAREESKAINIPPTAPPWEGEVKAAAVLDEVCATLARFVWMKPSHNRAVALWIVLSYLHDVVDILPLLLITSPEEECGKTTLAELVYNLSNRPIAASNISSAAVYRTIKDDCPTLILDEADTYLREDEILRGVINSGHKRKFAFVIRVVNDKGDTGQFTTWCPKTIAMIGLPKRTILSRSIHNRLGRKPKNIKTEKLKEHHYQEFEELRRKISRLANDIRGQVKAFKDESLDNRAGDNWQPLFAIAAAAGEEWLQEAKLAAQRISKKDAEEMKGFGRYLLESLDQIIQEKRKKENIEPTERIFLRSLDLCNELNQDQEAPWKDKPDGIDALRLSKTLKEYDIVPKRAREGSDRCKGYWSDEIEKAVQQYARNED
jgi:putative DNA primase/helicase